MTILRQEKRFNKENLKHLLIKEQKEYFVFNNDDEINDHIRKEQILTDSSLYNLEFVTMSLEVVKLFPLKEFEHTSLEHFNKLQKLLDK